MVAVPGQVTLVIQGYEDLEILESLARLAGDEHLTQIRGFPGFRNLVAPADLPRLELQGLRCIHLLLKLTEGYEDLRLMRMGDKHRHRHSKAASVLPHLADGESWTNQVCSSCLWSKWFRKCYLQLQLLYLAGAGRNQDSFLDGIP